MNSQRESSDEPVLTGDGSHTIIHKHLKEYYHSLHGALEESRHIFLGLGLLPKIRNQAGSPVTIFEMGFGTGLNALLSWQAADQASVLISYTGIEAYPLDSAMQEKLNFGSLVRHDGLGQLYQADWNNTCRLSPFFEFCKIKSQLEDFQTTLRFDVVYYDAFSPVSQPELWTEEVFAKLAGWMIKGGYLVTYSSKGTVKRALESAGFRVEKHPGPGRKREVIRAIRL